MKFKSVNDLISAANLNATAVRCLAESGALSSLEEELNELEAKEYASSLLEYYKSLEDYNRKLNKYEDIIKNKEERFFQQKRERDEKQRIKEEKFQQRKKQYEEKLQQVKEENDIRASTGKKLLKLPTEPKRPKPLKEVELSNIPNKPTPPLFPELPRIVLSPRDRIKLQKEILQVYISGHPLDEVPDDHECIEIRWLKELDEESPWCTIRGVLQSFQVKPTRKGPLMVKLRLEDKSGSIEAVAFPKMYEKIRDILEKGELYKLKGKVDIRKHEGNDGEEYIHVQVICSDLEKIRIGSAKEWEIRYPLLKGEMRILPGRVQKSQGVAKNIIQQKARQK